METPVDVQVAWKLIEPHKIACVRWSVSKEFFGWNEPMENRLVELNSTQIAETIEANDTEFCCHWAQSPGVKLTRDPLWYRLISEIAHPYFNCIFEARLPPDQISTSIDQAISPFRERKLPMAWWIGPKTQPDTLSEALECYGFELVASEAAMAINPSVADYELASEEVEVQAVNTTTDLRTWVEIMTGVYELPEFTQEPWFQILKKAGLGSRKKLQHFLARVDGEVAGVGSLFYGTQAAGIYNIAVLPQYRGQGVASTLTISLLSLVEESGHEMATLCSSQKAKSLYRRIGFRVYGEMSCYQRSAD